MIVPTTERDKRGNHLPRSERGWVLIATLILTAVAASITVGWARHAVLSKGQLEFATGASRTEEASRSGFDRLREQMRRGQPPGSDEDGEEEHVITEDGDEVRVSRTAQGHDQREVDVEVRHEGGGDHREAALRGRAEVVPGSQGGGKRTRLRNEDGDKVLLVPGLTMVTGELVFTPSSDLEGIYVMLEGSRMVLEDCTLTGAIVSEAALSDSNPLTTGANRPVVEVRGGFLGRPGADLADLLICGPDLRFEATTDAQIDVSGMVVAEEVDLPCRGAVRGTVVTEVSENIGPNVQRPGHGRGVQDFPACVEPGSERMTRISFPTDEFTVADMDVLEAYDVLADL